MKINVVLVLLLTYCGVLAQTPVYQPTDVDSVAEPRGGMAFFNTFVQATLRKPIQAQALGAGGRVIVGGVVEPNGTITDVKVLVGSRPDFDQEAARTFALFNAWKPAKKNGQFVRQQVTVPVNFEPNEPFIYMNGKRIDYLNKRGEIVTDSINAQYKRIIPIDTIGIPIEDAIVYEYKEKSWSEYIRLPFFRESDGWNNKTNIPLYTVGNKNSNTLQWEGKIAVLAANNVLVRVMTYKNGKQYGSEIGYYPNGSVAKKEEYLDNHSSTMSWYANGQIRKIMTNNYPTPSLMNPPNQVLSIWDSLGHQMVKEGNGQAFYQNRVKSKKDSSLYTQYLSRESYVNGLKQGIAIENYVDGSYYVEEQYDKGLLVMGKLWRYGIDTLRYSIFEQQPEFIGGFRALGQYLAKNMKYPVAAQKANVSGKVFVSFVIASDGSVENVQVVKGLGYGCDEECVRIIKSMNGKWKPGLQRGEKVPVKYTMPLNFTFN